MIMRMLWRWVLPVAGVVLPVFGFAQDAPASSLSSDIHGLQGTLETVYNSMMVHCGELVSVGRSLAGFGALLYVFYRVWGHLARAESVDVYPLLRPFALGLVLTFYPAFLGVLNGVLQPTVTGTSAIVDSTNKALGTLLTMEQQAEDGTLNWQSYWAASGEGPANKWEQYTGVDTGAFVKGTTGLFYELTHIGHSIRNMIRSAISELLQVVYEAAALCINTLRTFELLLLGILGPLVLGLSAFPGFEHLLTAWLGRYINIFLWLPVTNIFSSIVGQIQEEMIKIDLAQMASSGQTTFGSTDAAYLIFLIIAIVGYFCVPSITNHIINVFPSGGGAHLDKVSGGAGAAAMAPVNAGMAAAKGMGGMG